MTIRNLAIATTLLASTAAFANPIGSVGSIDLDTPKVLVRGMKATFAIKDRPGRSVAIMVSPYTTDKFDPVCPDGLVGACLDLSPNFETIAMVNGDFRGNATFSDTVPEATGDWIVVQAATANNAKAWISRPIILQVLDADGDEDGDGFSNGAEYLFGSDPLTPDAP